jgi:hypothetical protein
MLAGLWGSVSTPIAFSDLICDDINRGLIARIGFNLPDASPAITTAIHRHAISGLSQKAPAEHAARLRGQ